MRGMRSRRGPTALHEHVHFVLRNGEAIRYPAWYDEGLAEFLSTVTLADVIPATGLFEGSDDQGNGTTQVDTANWIANFDFQNGPDSLVRRDSTGVYRWRFTFADDRLRRDSDSVEVHPDPPASTP